MSLYGALNIGVAGLNADSQALSVTSSNIANVNTVGYKDATASFSTFLNSSLGASSNASAGVTADDRPGCRPRRACPPPPLRPPICRSRATASSSSAPPPAPPATQEYTRAGSFTPDSNGNLVNATGHYLLG